MYIRLPKWLKVFLVPCFIFAKFALFILGSANVPLTVRYVAISLSWTHISAFPMRGISLTIDGTNDLKGRAATSPFNVLLWSISIETAAARSITFPPIGRRWWGRTSFRPSLHECNRPPGLVGWHNPWLSGQSECSRLGSLEQELLLEGRGDFQIVDLARFMILDCGMKSTLEYWSAGMME